MSSFSIRGASHTYQVSFVEGLPDLSDWSAVVLDSNVAGYFSPGANIIPVQVAEADKTLDMVGQVCRDLEGIGLKKDSRLLAIGGGWTQDIVTMAASIYRRGIRWDFAPTTLMAMADSAIGGKSSINLGESKNILGNFYPPQEIILVPRFLRSISVEHIVAGLAEAVKIVFARGDEAFKKYLNVPESHCISTDADYSLVVELSLQSKKWFVEEDEFDTGVRKLLNFGHTFAHALEAATKMTLQHGNAVLLGMMAAIHFADATGSDKCTELLDYCMFLAPYIRKDLEISLTGLDWETFSRALAADKKGNEREIVFVVPNSLGELELRGFPRVPETLQSAEVAMKWAIERVSHG